MASQGHTTWSWQNKDGGRFLHENAGLCVLHVPSRTPAFPQICGDFLPSLKNPVKLCCQSAVKIKPMQPSRNARVFFR